MDDPGRLARRDRRARGGDPPGAAARPDIPAGPALRGRDGRVTRLTTCPEPEAVAARAAGVVRRAIDSAREARGEAHVALSGGTTPGRTYELLAADGGGWGGV